MEEFDLGDIFEEDKKDSLDDQILEFIIDNGGIVVATVKDIQWFIGYKGNVNDVRMSIWNLKNDNKIKTDYIRSIHQRHTLEII